MQGVLDEHFLQLQQLEDETSLNFIAEVVNIFPYTCEKLLRNLPSLPSEKEVTKYGRVGVHLNQIMGISSSIGANCVRNVCIAFRPASEKSNRSGCLRALTVLEHEFCYLNNELLSCEIWVEMLLYLFWKVSVPWFGSVLRRSGSCRDMRVLNSVIEVEGVTDDETNKGDEKASEEKVVPNFWVNAMKTNEVFSCHLCSRDAYCTKSSNPFANVLMSELESNHPDGRAVLERAHFREATN